MDQIKNLKINKPTSPGIRHKLKIKKSLLSKTSFFLKKNRSIIKQNSGRSSSFGKITVRHKGGGVKRRLCKITKNEGVSIVVAVFYQPLRNTFLCINFIIKKKIFSFNLLTEYTTVGSLIESCYNNFLIKNGSYLLLKNIFVGSLISTLSFKNRPFVYSKSSGSFSQIIQKTNKECKIRLPSGKIISVLLDKNFATLGSIYDNKHNQVVLGKAGKNRLKGIRPSVRGAAMNPVDHPHGGRTRGGMAAMTPWGKLTKGVKTSKKI